MFGKGNFLAKTLLKMVTKAQHPLMLFLLTDMGFIKWSVTSGNGPWIGGK